MSRQGHTVTDVSGDAEQIQQSLNVLATFGEYMQAYNTVSQLIIVGGLFSLAAGFNQYVVTPLNPPSFVPWLIIAVSIIVGLYYSYIDPVDFIGTDWVISIHPDDISGSGFNTEFYIPIGQEKHIDGTTSVLDIRTEEIGVRCQLSYDDTDKLYRLQDAEIIEIDDDNEKPEPPGKAVEWQSKDLDESFRIAVPNDYIPKPVIDQQEQQDTNEDEQTTEDQSQEKLKAEN